MGLNTREAMMLWIVIRRLVCNSAMILGLGVFLSLAMSPSVDAQALLWAKRAGGTQDNVAFGIAVDGSGNSYVTGYLFGSATFGPGEANATTLTSAGGFDVFLAKYNSSGTLLWAKRAGGTDSDLGFGIAVDGSGNSYVIGYFEGSATFGPGEANQTTLTAAGANDVFLAKYNSSGALQWTRRAGGTDSDGGFSIAVDGSGNSYVTGSFELSATFGPGEANQTVLTSAGTPDIFVAKYNSSGALQWAKRAGGTGDDEGFGIAVDASGNSYLTGYFEGLATFGPGEANQTVLTSAGTPDIFVAKYNSSGALQWAKRAGGTGDDEGFGIAVDASGNSYMTGVFSGSATFGFGGPTISTLVSAGNDDVFVAKYDSSGALLWARRAGGATIDYGNGIAVDASGNSYVTGVFNGSATFGPGELNQTMLTSAGSGDIFVAKYNSSGATQWVKRAGGTGGDEGLGIAVDSSGNSYVTGAFNGSATFGPGELKQIVLTSDGFEDIFVAKFRYSEMVHFSGLAVTGGQNIFTAGVETTGLSRGPAFQTFNTAGVVQITRFALNPDFRDNNFVLGNLDGDAPNEVLVGGRETSGLSRGPAYQLFDSNGAFMFTRFALNPDFTGVSFSSFDVNSSNGVLACGLETTGAARGPAYQAFDSSGTLVRTQFALNTDFATDNACLGINLDGVAGDEVIMGGSEVTGLARGPALQAFNSNGSLRFTQFVLNPSFTETKFIVADIGSNGIIAYGRETSGANRGPAFQTFGASGNFILTRFVLNPDFTTFQVFGANTTNTVTGDEIVTGGTETSGLARGPAIQVWDKNGNHLFTRFVLNPDFTEVRFEKIDIDNDGVHEIIAVGRETQGLKRGPVVQLFDGSGNHLMTRFVLNSDFTNLKFFAIDQNGDGDKEIGIGGVEPNGLSRGPAYQVFESNGTLLQVQFVLNGDF